MPRIPPGWKVYHKPKKRLEPLVLGAWVIIVLLILGFVGIISAALKDSK